MYRAVWATNMSIEVWMSTFSENIESIDEYLMLRYAWCLTPPSNFQAVIKMAPATGVLGRIPGCVRQLLCTVFWTTSASSPGVTPLLLPNGCLHYHGGAVGQRLTAWCIADGREA